MVGGFWNVMKHRRLSWHAEAACSDPPFARVHRELEAKPQLSQGRKVLATRKPTSPLRYPGTKKPRLAERRPIA